MTADLDAATTFVHTNARVLERHRLALLRGEAGGEPVVRALLAYRNEDGGFGHGLEPDLRAPESQPAAAWHAFEVFADVAPVTAPEAVELCDYLDAVALPDGGLPFGLPIEDPRGTAPFWAEADPQAFSLQITAIVAAHANRVAAHDPAVAGHPWLARATSCCLAAIAALEGAPEAYVLAFALQLLDAVHDREAMALWQRAFHSPTAPGSTGDRLVFHRLPGHDLDTEAHSTLFSGEQSNSTVMFGERVFAELRRIARKSRRCGSR